MKSKSILVVLTEEEFGAVAGAVSTEFRRLGDMHPDNPAAKFVGSRLRSAWAKILGAWHPDVAEETIASSDWVTLFDPSFDPNNPQTGDAEVYDIEAYRRVEDVKPVS